MNEKIFITGPSIVDKLSIAKSIIEQDDDLSIAERFSNDDTYANTENDEYIYYLSTQDIDLTYKNNFILFVETNNYVSSGITMDNFYNNDIFVMSLSEFNNISDIIFKSESNDIVLVWVDSSSTKISNSDIVESSFLQERINLLNIKYLYFFNEETEKIVNIVLDYFNGDESKRNELLEENN